MSSINAALPLEGIRILDFSRVLAGPWCAMVLGDLGAEVIKVEHPLRGDDTRDWGLRIGATETSYFNSVNRNKRSVTLDLQTPEGQQLARDLAAKSDVVVQNFKFGGIEKMGLGYEQLSAERPELIYCSITGYDRTGPEAARPGYDLVIQGESGLMALNGEANQPPLKFGVAVVDIAAGTQCTGRDLSTNKPLAATTTENIPLGPLATLMPLLQMAGVLNDNNIKNALKQVRECQEQLVVLDRSHCIKVRRGGK